MEDHCDAYPAWKGLAVRGEPCVHLDAHLDLSDEGFPRETLQAILACRDAAELEAFRSDPRLPWGGYHAGNYLYPAVLDATVSHLFWVIPPWLPRGGNLLEWTRGELQKWYDVTLDDYANLRVVHNRVEGTILGRAFTLCTVEHLPRFDRPVLLDVDVDYFLDADDTIFAEPERIFETLHEKNVVPRSTTVSYSVNGGYLPLEQRYVGDLVLAVARGDATGDALAAARVAIAADRRRARGALDEAIRGYQRVLDGGHFAAPMHFKLWIATGKREHAIRAAELDGHYRPRALDVAFVHFRRKDHARTVDWLQRARGEDPDFAPLATYVEGLSWMRAGEVGQAIARWETLVDEPTFRPAERAYLYVVLGRALYRVGRGADALVWLRRAVALEPSNALYQQHLGNVLYRESLFEEAAKHLRKSIALDDKRLSVLDAHRHLADVYETTGHRLMADAERRRLAARDVLGTASVEALLRRHT